MHPLLTDKIDFLESVPVMRNTLLEFTDSITKQNPLITFDYSIINELERENLWFIDILHK